MYEKKVADGFEVLEVEKGTWVEAIFAKLKPETVKPRMKFETHDEDEIPEDNYNSPDEDDDSFYDDVMNEDNYRTTFEIESDPDEEAESISDFGGED